MRYILILCGLCYSGLLAAATLAPPPNYVGTWPPAWVGTSLGSDATVQDPNPVEGDASHAFDYGKDEWGYWAHLEQPGAGGSVVKIEMRYIDVDEPDYSDLNYGNGAINGAYIMGAPANEVGSRDHERPQVKVEVREINGGAGMWVSADECNQAMWESVLGVELIQMKHGNNSRGAVVDSSFSAGTHDHDLNTTVAFIGDKASRGVESQTYANVVAFCTVLSANISKTVDLPTEKEWEYLCRSGTATAFYTGRLLEGFTGFSDGGLTVNTNGDFMFEFDRAQIEADKLNIPNGDESSGGVTPKWRVPVSSVNSDGIAMWVHYRGFKGVIGGSITISGGSSMQMNIVAQFDSRYQHRYFPDHYGSHTSILMLYESVAGEYVARPYGDPNAANMYYRYLEEPRDYVATSLVRTNGLQNHSHTNFNLAHDPFAHQETNQAGDWYNDGTSTRQLEYREMVQVLNRFSPLGSADPRNVNLSDWEERFDGSHVLVLDSDSSGTPVRRMYPIHSFYTPYRFNGGGSAATQTLPIEASDAQIIDQAKNTVPENQKGKNSVGDDMTVNDYKRNYQEVLDAYYRNNDFDPGFWEAVTQAEKDNIDKSSIVAMRKGYTPMQDAITVDGVDSVTTTIAANGRSPWGFLNMHGNLDEWTKTEWDGKSGPNRNTSGFQVTRGGSWRTGANRCRSAARTARDPNKAYNDVGFRFIIRN